MASLTLRSVKGTPLTNSEVDANFTSLNTDIGTRLLASSNLSDLADVVAARTNLGLGSLATQSSLKTVNGQSVLGSGNIQIDGGVTSFNTRTGAITLSSTDVTTALGFTPYNASNPSGFITSSALMPYLTSAAAASTYQPIGAYLTGITSSQVTTALGFTPLSNATSYLPLAGGTLSGGVSTTANGFLTLKAIGAGTYNIGALYLDATMMSWESPLTTDVVGGAKVPFYLTWRGGYASQGGLKLTGGSSGELGGNAILHAGNYSSYALPVSGGTLTGSRSIYFDTSGGGIQLKGDAGGWGMGLYFKGSDDVVKGSFGALGSGSSFSYLWAGVAYNNTWMTFTSSQINSSVALTQNNNQVLHAGNYTSYALPLSGGDMSGRIRMGTFSASTSNAGEAWIGRASDRAAGTLTVQLGVDANKVFEVVDNAWSTVIFNAGMNAFSYKGNAVLHAGNIGNYQAGGLVSRYNYPQGTYISDSTSAVTLSPDNVGATTVSMHNLHGLFGSWATTLTMSGYERYGAYQISGDYNATTPQLAIRNYNQTSAGWTSWVRLLSSANYSSYALPLTGGTITGDGYITFGPNSGWSRSLRVGGNGFQGSSTIASVATTNGNLHLDGATGGYAVYLNWYGGTSGTFFGNGASGQVGRVDGAGNASFSGQVSSSGNNGFANATWYGGVRNPIWYFGNSSTYGISYFQGAAGRDGIDTIGLHPNGTATATGSAFAVNSSNAFVNNNVVLHAGNYNNYVPQTFLGWSNYDANTLYNVGYARSAFTYANNAPWTGPLAMLPAQGYDLQFNAQYAGDEMSFRARNGDNGTWRPWKRVLTDYNISSFAVVGGSSPTFSEIYHNNWVRSNGTGGHYWQNYGRGLWVADGEFSYGNIGTYGSGLNGWRGYGVYPNNLVLMANGSTWGFYSPTGGIWYMISDSAGNTTFNGNVTAYSDLRLKQNVREIDNVIARRDTLAKAAIKYERDGRTRVGYGAQTLRDNGCEEFVLEADDALKLATGLGTLSVDYGETAAVLAVVSKMTDDRVADLEAKVARLELALSKLIGD